MATSKDNSKAAIVEVASPPSSVEVKTNDEKQPLQAEQRKFPPARTAEEFRTMQLPPKETLVEGILYRRDLVAFAGRRRNGKTSALVQLALSLTVWAGSAFLGRSIPQRRRVLLYLLEDDSRELQDRLNRMLEVMEDAGDTEGRLLIRTKDDFYPNGIAIGVEQKDFRAMIEEDCKQHKPDVIIFDNLGFLVGADYTDSKTVHKYMQFKTHLSQKYNAAVVTAAHPRKLGNTREPASLVKDRDMFFEEVMGSSHFVNSCGSLWGVERTKEGYSHLYLGTQRLSGNAALVAVEMDDEGWFSIADNFDVNFKLVVHTSPRQKAWASLPETFTYTEARNATKSAIKSKNAFTPFWNALKQARLIVSVGGKDEEEEKRFKKANDSEPKKEDGKKDGGGGKEIPEDLKAA